MKKYTQAEFDAIERDEYGYKHLPSGDWTGVDFGGQMKLIFGDGCTLGDDCKLGNWCKLGNGCTLGDWCELGNRCTLGDDCKLGYECELGNRCTLGDDCKLGNWCKLGYECKLGNRCELEGGRVENAAFFFASNIGSENRTAYAYCNTKTGEVFVRAGCWFSDLPAFIERVKSVHGGTQHEVDYLAFAEFAKARFARYMPKEGEHEAE